MTGSTISFVTIRGIPERNFAAHRGGWVKTATGSNEVRGKTLGIVGYGHIGTQVGLLAESFLHDIVEPFLMLRIADQPSRAQAAQLRRPEVLFDGDDV